ncbi:class I SAM-dependent methyltransferase [Cytophaga aurantiaca]|uniref:class I SAM-dependent methyltransferase n=1 Tax=Cytophaga aurantiaca TaxID=29530 RepID=UPI001FE12371|nr:class I SAM-dependent methyltransferase [Cytophaga aurantiaca]
MSNSKTFSSKDIATYYDVSEDHYMYFWDLNQSRALHYGYWEDTTKTFREALANINKILSEKANINEGTKVLDAGCGIGGSSIWLAKNKQANVTGITLSAKQAARANAYVKEIGLQDCVQFQVKDFTQTDFDEQSFDVVWAIESVCHASNKEDFVKEAYRLLKPGGRLIMADFFIVKDGNETDERELNAWGHGWAVPFFEKESIFHEMLERSGFRSIQMMDATKNIIKSAKRLYYAFFPGWIVSKIYNLVHKNTTEFSKNNVYTAYYQYKTLKKGLWKYCIIHATK